MFNLKIAGVTVCFQKFFSEADVATAFEAIHSAGSERIVLIDNPATVHTVAFIKKLKEEGKVVLVRYHHDATDEEAAKGGRPAQVRAANDEIRALLGDSAVIRTRVEHPACSTLLKPGEFAVGSMGGNPDPTDDAATWGIWASAQDAVHADRIEKATVIVADADADGLTAACKAAGVTWPELDADAAVLDGPRAGQTADKLSANALLLVRAMSALPPFDAARPEVSEKAKAELFGQFVSVVQGDLTAKAALEKKAEAYEAGVKEAERLAGSVTDIIPGVVFVDVTASPRFDMGTLATKMENRTGCKVTVQRKSQGPIAAKHNGIQISLAVAKVHQTTVNLQELLPTGFVSSPETGIISNTSFLLHVSENVWNETVLPALRARFGV